VGLRFIVRRGALRRFDRLQQAAAELPVDVIWDRRIPDETANRPSRIAAAVAERRQQPSFTWTAADFVLVEEEDTH
jgi:hypothetical protein